jgi:hypothetical protein
MHIIMKNYKTAHNHHRHGVSSETLHKLNSSHMSITTLEHRPSTVFSPATMEQYHFKVRLQWLITGH